MLVRLKKKGTNKMSGKCTQSTKIGVYQPYDCGQLLHIHSSNYQKLKFPLLIFGKPITARTVAFMVLKLYNDCNMFMETAQGIRMES